MLDKRPMKRKPIRKVSDKQRAVNVALRKIKRELPDFCCVCGKPCLDGDTMHLLPRSLFPEYKIEVWNLRKGHRECHQRYDNDLAFRQRQMHIFNHLCQHDEQAARRYFRFL